MICQILHYVTASAPPHAGPYSGNAHGNVGPYFGDSHGDGGYPTLLLMKRKNSFMKMSNIIKHICNYLLVPTVADGPWSTRNHKLQPA
jgi:hypothetical protein